MGSWGCPHEMDGACQRVNMVPCDVGMRGCVLYGRFAFSNPAKNHPAQTSRTPAGKKSGSASTGPEMATGERPAPSPSTD